MQAITRLTVALAVALTDAVPTAASNPPSVMKLPSTDRLRWAAVTAVPLSVIWRFRPNGAVGNAIVWTGLDPAQGWNSSRNTGVAALVSGAVPSPTRTTTTFPGVNP